MRSFFGGFLSLLILQGSMLDSTRADETDNSVSVSKAEAKCIAEYVDVFLEDTEDPVTIYLDICMTAEQLTGSVAGSVRGDLPTIAPSKTDAKPTRSIVISKLVLRCLKEAARKNMAIV